MAGGRFLSTTIIVTGSVSEAERPVPLPSSVAVNVTVYALASLNPGVQVKMAVWGSKVAPGGRPATVYVTEGGVPSSGVKLLLGNPTIWPAVMWSWGRKRGLSGSR